MAETRASTIQKHLCTFLLVALGVASAADGVQTAKIVAIKKHAEGRIVSWQGNLPAFDGYPFYDIILEWNGKNYAVRYESPTGYYPEYWAVGKVIHAQRESGAFRIFRGTEAVLVNVHDCVQGSIRSPGKLPQVPCD